MVRVPLEELVLQIHLLRLGPAAGFLATVLQPPPKAAVDSALATLRAVGALTEDEHLTPLGKCACNPSPSRPTVQSLRWMVRWRVGALRKCSQGTSS